MCKLYTLQSAEKPRRSLYHVNGRLDTGRIFLYIRGVQRGKEGGAGAVEFWRKNARYDETARGIGARGGGSSGRVPAERKPETKRRQVHA